MKLPGHRALAGRTVRLTAVNAGLDAFPTPATYIVKADADGDFETEHRPAPGPYDVAVQTTAGGWASPSNALGAAGKGLDQYVVGGWPG